jgi:hypothetical protein
LSDSWEGQKRDRCVPGKPGKRGRFSIEIIGGKSGAALGEEKGLDKWMVYTVYSE